MKIKREVLDDENDTEPGQMYSTWNAPGTVQAEPRENHIDIRPTVSGRIESGRSLEDTQGTSERRSFLDVFSQYIAASQETEMGEDSMYSEERDIHLDNIKKEPDDVHSEAQVDDEDQFSSVEEFEVQEKRRGRWATERTDSGNKCLSEERNNHDSTRPGSVQDIDENDGCI